MFQPELKTNDLVGAWVGKGNAKFSLADSGSMTGRQIPFNLMDPDTFHRPWTGTGRWGLGNEQNEIKFVVGDWSVNRVPVFHEHGDWVITFFIGDPDENQTYAFHKAR